MTLFGHAAIVAPIFDTTHELRHVPTLIHRLGGFVAPTIEPLRMMGTRTAV